MKEYYIRFSVNLFLVIDEEFRMNIKPFQNAELILHPSKGTPNVIHRVMIAQLIKA